MQRVPVLERGRIVRADSAADKVDPGTPDRRVLPQRLYDRLMRLELGREERGEDAVFSWRRNHALVGPWVGVIQIPGLQLELLPKTDLQERKTDESVRDVRQNLMEMLRLGGLGAIRSRGVADLAVKRGNVHDQLVDAFLDRALFELRRGLDRGYTAEEDNLQTLRGKLVLGRHVAKNAAQKTRFYCRFDALTEDTAIMVRLKQALRVLSLRTLPAELLVKCRLLLALLDDVEDRSFLRHGNLVVFSRQNQRFEDLYDFATFILQGQAPDAKAGDVETFSLLYNMERVFESYIAAFLKAEVMPVLEDTSLFPQGRGHRHELFRDNERAILTLKPDILIRSEKQGAMIIDTKWKRITGEDKKGPANADLYQLYAYLHRYDCERVVLLYPRVADVPHRDLDALIGDEKKRRGQVLVRYVDLNRKLTTREGKRALAADLAAIVAEGLKQSPLTSHPEVTA